MDKKLIDVYVTSYDIYEFSGDVKGLIKTLSYCVEEYGEDCFLKTDSYDDEPHCLYLYKKRLETDAEYEKRITKEEIALKMKKYKKAQKEKRELEEYEKLKKKFG